MAVTVARVHLAMAHAALPGLLPTPPKTAILTAAGIPILPAKSPSKAKPGRADAVERWDAHKIRPGSPSPSSSSGSSPCSPSNSPGCASSCDRWDSNKKCPSSAAAASRTPLSERKPDSNSKRPVSRSSSAERWDLHKRPCAEEAGGGLAGGSGNKEVDKLRHAIYAGPCFFASPEPFLLPVPAFTVHAI